MSSVSLLVFGAILVFLPKSQGCSPAEGWHTMTFPQRMVQADIVAYVKVLNKTETPGKDNNGKSGLGIDITHYMIKRNVIEVCTFTIYLSM